MKKIVLILLLIIPTVVSAQRMELYTHNSFNYIALYGYGLPRSVVKTNTEMRESQWYGNGTGVMKRHHTTKGIDGEVSDKGYNCNDKISFAFMIAPYNVDRDGNHTSDIKLNWAEASGWDPTVNDELMGYSETTGIGEGNSTLAESATGCAAYKGLKGTDNAGEWRLPTQREIQIMFTVIEQSLGYIVSNKVEHEIIEGLYWTSTEFYASGAKGHAWSINSTTGRPNFDFKTKTRMTRCVKDIYEQIND